MVLHHRPGVCDGGGRHRPNLYHQLPVWSLRMLQIQGRLYLVLYIPVPLRYGIYIPSKLIVFIIIFIRDLWKITKSAIHLVAHQWHVCTCMYCETSIRSIWPCTHAWWYYISCIIIIIKRTIFLTAEYTWFDSAPLYSSEKAIQLAYGMWVVLPSFWGLLLRKRWTKYSQNYVRCWRDFKLNKLINFQYFLIRDVTSAWGPGHFLINTDSISPNNLKIPYITSKQLLFLQRDRIPPGRPFNVLIYK